MTDLDLWTNDLLSVIRFICAWYWLIVTSFIKTHPFHSYTRYKGEQTDGQTHWLADVQTTQQLNALAPIVMKPYKSVSSTAQRLPVLA